MKSNDNQIVIIRKANSLQLYCNPKSQNCCQGGWGFINQLATNPQPTRVVGASKTTLGTQATSYQGGRYLHYMAYSIPLATRGLMAFITMPVNHATGYQGW
jgi:hypothetical protein